MLRLILGVPDITPYASIDKPLGSAGEMYQLAIAPPLFVKVIGVIERLRVSTALLCDAVMLAGCSMMVRLNVVEFEPPELFAQTVKVVVLRLTVGVPEITP